MDGIQRSQRAKVAWPPLPARVLAAPAVAPEVPTVGMGVRGLVLALESLAIASDSPGLIDEIRDLEELKSAISARHARAAVAFDLAQRAEQAHAGIPAAERGMGVAAQVAMARRESPHKGSRLLGLAKALVMEMPRTLAALESGQLNEWRATLLVKETACLSVEDRAAVDEELAPDTGTFDGAGDKAIISAARAAAYRRDPRSVAQRASHAATERTVSLRPAPDTMTYLTALLPVAQGVAVYAALTRTADSVRSSGDERTRGQVMADTLTERVTGTPGGVAGINLNLVITDRTLLQGDTEPARLDGYGIVPAEWARALLVNDPDRSEFAVLLRRLHRSRQWRAPDYGLKSTILPATVAELHPRPGQHMPYPLLRRAHPAHRPCHSLAFRRQHTSPQRGGAVRSLQPHQGNPGWAAASMPGDVHTLQVSTPTGHSYQSKAPPLPGHKPARVTN